MPKNKKALNVCPVCNEAQLVQYEKVYLCWPLNEVGETDCEDRHGLIQTYEEAFIECRNCNSKWPNKADNQDGGCTADNCSK